MSRELFAVDDLDRFKSPEVDAARREETGVGYAVSPASGTVEVMRFDPTEYTDGRFRSGKHSAMSMRIDVHRDSGGCELRSLSYDKSYATWSEAKGICRKEGTRHPAVINFQTKVYASNNVREREGMRREDAAKT